MQSDFDLDLQLLILGLNHVPYMYVYKLFHGQQSNIAPQVLLKPLCLSKQLTLCSQQHIDQLFPGHVVYVVC